MRYCPAFFLFFLFACSNEPKQVTSNTAAGNNVDVTTTKQVADTIVELQIETFDIPASIEGCSGVYAADSVSLRKGRFTFVTDLQQTAFVKVNGRLLPLQLGEKQPSGKVVDQMYTAAGIQVHLRVSADRRIGDELWLYSGEVTIVKGNQQIIIPVIGEVGC